MRNLLCFVAFISLTFALKNAQGPKALCNCKHCICECKNLNRLDDLNDQSSQYPKHCLEFQLHLLHSRVTFLTRDIFPVSNNGVMKRFILYLFNSTVYTFFPPCFPNCPLFDMPKFQTAIVKVENSGSLNGWNWGAFEHFSPSGSSGNFELYLVKSDLIHLPDEFNRMANGKASSIRILGCGLRWMGKHVFGPFSQLRTLELSNNRLETIERSQLPKPGSELSTLDLGKNRLTVIPPDLFDDLPRLTKVIINGNNILILHESSLNSIRKAELHSDAGILLQCECFSPWMLEEKSKRNHEEHVCLKGEKRIPFLAFRTRCESWVHWLRRILQHHPAP